MDGSALIRLLAALGLTFALARLFGGLARRTGRPAVVGELAAGLLLGPAVLGRLMPGIEAWIFPAVGVVWTARHAVEEVAAAVVLLGAGLRLDLGMVARVGPKATALSGSGMLISFFAGLVPGLWAPSAVGWDGRGSPIAFALLLGTLLLISALPAIARTLIDLELLGTDVGMVVRAGAVTQDIVGWSLFGIVCGLFGSDGPAGVAFALAGPVALALLTVTLGARLLDPVLARADSRGPFAGGALVVGAGLLAAAIARELGGQAILGSFFVGLAIGSGRRVPERVRGSIDPLVAGLFGPLLFGGIGLGLDFAATFDPLLVVTFLGLAAIGKVGGGFLGARLAGLGRREALAVGVATNTRGGMEVVMGSAALQAGLIDGRLFTAVVATSLATTGVGAPLTRMILEQRRSVRFADHLAAPTFVPRLEARRAEDAIRELARVLAGVTGLPAGAVADAVLLRERAMATGIPGEIAVPHASFPGLTRPLMAVGLVPEGVDFGAPDGLPARIVCLVLTPSLDPSGQTGLLAEIGRTLHRPQVREALPRIREFSEFAALVRSAESDRGAPVGS